MIPLGFKLGLVLTLGLKFKPGLGFKLGLGSTLGLRLKLVLWYLLYRISDPMLRWETETFLCLTLGLGLRLIRIKTSNRIKILN